MHVCVMGTGYVGLVTGACLAEIGHQVVCMDDDARKIEILLAGGMPIYEPYLEGMVKRGRAAGHLQFTTDVTEAVREAALIFICVNTPPLPDGEADLSYVELATRRIAEHASRSTLITEKSTVPVQTGAWIEKTLAIYSKRPGVEFDVASNPEFTREGMAVEDFLHPDRIVVGVSSARAEQTLRELYAPIVEGRFRCPIHADCRQDRAVPFLVTDLRSAELIKHASNSFLAMKISFANALADVCELAGGDVLQVVKGVGLDKRIGRAFLNAGIGFGGSCFPKDVKAFVKIAEKGGYDFALLKEVDRINERRREMVLEKLKRALWILRGKRIGLLGLAFKPDTDDVRQAPALAIARRLLEEGAEVRGYDPQAAAKAQQAIPELTICGDPYEVGAQAEALILCTEWAEFPGLDWPRMKGQMVRPLILDGRNALDREKLISFGFEYIGIGR
ncbi:MAG: UDP-glucose 6-dehydrogenase [candidate division NC10 bacterium RIFCSPLOWO2_12_FULL_66_18]|nr:MAG: UDP-glucose 6-dehydrogenase [candidate division NC10 bacterium RIFCSPLOWO2_02_FULL_66_22]OGB97866.1 MAG: UDP-glucose 6-dehydrogenase [candidate division NC10 bacterium RIFCSPLOWO2_12_FULL_66_18]